MSRATLALLTVLTLTACGDDAPLPPGPTPTAPCDPVPGGPTVPTETRTSRDDGFATLTVRLCGARAHLLQARRGPAWDSTWRLLTVDAAGAELWRFLPGDGVLLSDVAVHPSGELTLALQHASRTRDAYELVRLRQDGTVRTRAWLPRPTTLPEADLGATLPPSPFRLASWPVDALTPGWVRLRPRGEGLVTALLSLAEPLPGNPESPSTLASGVLALDWTGEGWTERWARILDGAHAAGPVGWAYDEFRWSDATLRPLLAVADDGTIVVGRTWTTTRCLAVAATFGERTRPQCLDGSASHPLEVEYQPFAFTVFGADGTRQGTRGYAPQTFRELVVFDLDVAGDRVALAGTVVRAGPDDPVPYYPPSPGAEPSMTPYDGLLVVLSRADGAVVLEREVGEGRGDFLAAVRFTPSGTGLVAAGGSGFDRWYGGMSVSRAAHPLLVQLPLADGATSTLWHGAEGPGDRHATLFTLDVAGTHLHAGGAADAPMTHSGDGGHAEHMTFGGLDVRAPLPLP